MIPKTAMIYQILVDLARPFFGACRQLISRMVWDGAAAEALVMNAVWWQATQALAKANPAQQHGYIE